MAPFEHERQQLSRTGEHGVAKDVVGRHELFTEVVGVERAGLANDEQSGEVVPHVQPVNAARRRRRRAIRRRRDISPDSPRRVIDSATSRGCARGSPRTRRSRGRCRFDHSARSGTPSRRAPLPFSASKIGARRLVHHERRDEFVVAQHREARRIERDAAIAVRRPVDRIDDHRELAVARDPRLFTHDAEPGAAEHTPRDVVGRHVEVILRRSIPRKSSTAMRLHRFTNLVCARRAAALKCELFTLPRYWSSGVT